MESFSVHFSLNCPFEVWLPAVVDTFIYMHIAVMIILCEYWPKDLEEPLEGPQY